MPDTIPQKHFYMIRHGETVANADKIMAGAVDSPLTQTGIAQAQSVQALVKTLTIKPEIVVHSHLSRARDTARIINDALQLPMHEEPDYGEMYAGDWEGQPYEVCAPLFREWVNPPGGETCQEFFDRVRRAKKKTLQSHDTPLVVCHGGVFRAFWTLYGIHSHGVQNCKLYEFVPHGSAKDIFPWTVFRYDLQACGSVTRQEVIELIHNPASEITV